MTTKAERCPRCAGTGAVWRQSHTYAGNPAASYLEVCPACRGTGKKGQGDNHEQIERQARQGNAQAVNKGQGQR